MKERTDGKKESKKDQPPIWTTEFVLVIAMTLCCFIVGQGSNTGTSVFIEKMGGTAAFSGLMGLVFSVSAAITRIIAGRIVDKKGRAVVFIAGAIILTIGSAAAFLLPHAVALPVGRALQGAGFSIATTALATAAADILPYQRLGEGIGYFGLGQAISMAVGPALAMTLVSMNPPSILYLGLTVIALIALVISLFIRYEKNLDLLPETSSYRIRIKHRQEAAKGSPDANAAAEAADDGSEEEYRGLQRLFERRAVPGALPFLIISPAFAFGIYFVGLYGTTLHMGMPGLFYTLAAVSMIAIRLQSGHFMDRVAPLKIFSVAVCAGLVSYGLLFASSFAEPLYYVAGIVYGAQLGLALPVCQSIAVKGAPSNRWGAANALFMLFSDVGLAASALVWGFTNQHMGFAFTICCVMLCIAASLLVARKSFPKPRPDAR